MGREAGHRARPLLGPRHRHTDQRSRPAGLAVCLTDVLVKVSGDSTLADDPRVAALGAHAADLDYWDRMSGLPHHNAQGASDRPFNLTARFVPKRIDATLRDLGRTPWPDPRPKLLALIRVQGASGSFDLIGQEIRADRMRAALAESGERYGLRVFVPPNAAADAWIILTGTLALSEAAHGWVGRWHVDWEGRGYDWGLSGVNFDEAFRGAVCGALQIASGHGTPR